ncbi:MAG: hypothetical protein FWC64_04675 [Treponema sp.]|nr:hypothetical protein [Treponema sp.]
MRKIISVVGDTKIEYDGGKYHLAFELGKSLVDNGYRVQSGGKTGVMEAVFAGARTSEKYVDGDTIAILPSFDANTANNFADIVIPTGLDIMRDAIVVNASAVVAIGGGAGTLAEIAIAWSLYKLIIAYDNVDGWSAKLAGKKVDERIRYNNITNDRIFAVKTASETIKILEDNIHRYTRCHHGI